MGNTRPKLIIINAVEQFRSDLSFKIISHYGNNESSKNFNDKKNHSR